jgi:hypothetical protein
MPKFIADEPLAPTLWWERPRVEVKPVGIKPFKYDDDAEIKKVTVDWGPLNLSEHLKKTLRDIAQQSGIPPNHLLPVDAVSTKTVGLDPAQQPDRVLVWCRKPSQAWVQSQLVNDDWMWVDNQPSRVTK